MRRITKGQEPGILTDNAADWIQAYLDDPGNNTKKYRYRHPEIKKALVGETSSKCVYCESKIGHNTPGDVEHKIPSSARPELHFAWQNLTLACTECNRRKLAYYDPDVPFIDPNQDDVDNRILHLGPLVSWAPGDSAAEVSVRLLELHDGQRTELFRRKIETIDRLNNLVARLNKESGVLRELVVISVNKMRDKDSEFSAMISAVCVSYQIA